MAKKLTNEQLLDEVLQRFDEDGIVLEKQIGKESTISRHIAEAFKRRLIKIVPVATPLSESATNPQLAKQLKTTFSCLHNAYVIDTGEAVQHGQNEDLMRRRRDDEVHRKLGHAMATIISGGQLFHPHSIIGVGSGRGVYYTVATLKDFPPLRADDIALMSLDRRIVR